MKRISNKFKHWGRLISLGWFLAYRQVRRSSPATTILIVSVMALTFLNLVVVRGVLVGLIQGSTDVYKKYYAGDIIISSLPKKDYIENTPNILNVLAGMPWIENYSARYVQGGNVEAEYKTKLRETDAANQAGGLVAGINPSMEDATTNLSSKVVEGAYLDSSDSDSVLLGANLLKKYTNVDVPGFSLLERVEVGDKVRLKIGDTVREVTIKGFIHTKTDVDARIIMLDSTLRNLIGRSDYNVDEVAVKLKPNTDVFLVKEALLRSGVGDNARVQTADEALPSFLIDIKNTFALLGNVVGSIGLVVASITIFIVIFINAITRRKYIGILKGIGIESKAIEVAYVIQSVFYALLGILLGSVILYGFLVPFIDAHPIRFPFSDGILVAEVSSTAIRAGLLLFATIIAGYIPARIVVKQNTLDAILGRISTKAKKEKKT
jgi:ABC-type lipoprotein release transport system permease subunit